MPEEEYKITKKDRLYAERDVLSLAEAVAEKDKKHSEAIFKVAHSVIGEFNMMKNVEEMKKSAMPDKSDTKADSIKRILANIYVKSIRERIEEQNEQ